MNESSTALRRLIWLYFWLLMFEGALRKWVLPQFSNPLLIVRDPVVIAIYMMALRDGVFPRTAFVGWTCLIGVCCFAASVVGLGNTMITLFGFRANFLHLPLIVVMPRVLRREDVRQLGQALLTILPLMAVLAVVQFKVGPDSRWNVGAGAEAGGQLFAAQGKVRASGTFSFSTGIASYLALCSAFLLYDLLEHRVYPRWLALVGVPSLVLSLVVSGSRTAVLLVGIVCGTVLVMGAMRPAEFGVAVRPVLFSLVGVLLIAILTPYFDEGIEVHRQRFAGGGGFHEGIIVRFFSDFVAGWDALFRAPPLGIGLGVGTNAGARLLSGQREFLLGEGEWQRVIMESGPVFGTGYLALRAGVLVMALRTGLSAFRAGVSLPFLLAGAVTVDLLVGQFGQSTALGFAVFTAGLSLSAAQAGRIDGTGVTVEEVRQKPKAAGRSLYARRLHGEGEAG